jgi:hypothetical protein
MLFAFPHAPPNTSGRSINVPKALCENNSKCKLGNPTDWFQLIVLKKLRRRWILLHFSAIPTEQYKTN